MFVRGLLFVPFQKNIAKNEGLKNAFSGKIPTKRTASKFQIFYAEKQIEWQQRKQL